MNHLERIINDPSVFAGTRVPLRTVLASLAEGDFPSLKSEDIQEAIAFAAASGEDLPTPETSRIR